MYFKLLVVMLDRDQPHVETPFRPDDKRLLIDPVARVFGELHVQVPDHAGENEAHFGVG